MQPIKDYIFAAKDHYSGHVDPRFKDLATQFSRFQDARRHLGGAALCVYFQNQKVIDIYTGQKSETEKWQHDTLSVCYSTGKGVLVTLVHILVSEGHLEYDVPVAKYWPEFAQNGKDKITLAHMLSHQSGLFDIRNLINNAAEMVDWAHMLDVIAQAKPRFDVGADAAYQPLTFGWQIAGVLEKATGQSLSTLMQKYLVEPLALDGAYFGVPNTALARVARPIRKKKNTATSKDSAKQNRARKPNLMEKAIELSGQSPQDFQDAMIPKGMSKFNMFSDAGLQAVIPAANGVFSAPSLAKIYAMLAQRGNFENKQFISDKVFTRLSQVEYTKRDRVMPLPMHWRLGYHRVLTLGKASNGFGHIGFNGSGAWCDPERSLSFASLYTTKIDNSLK